MARTKPDADWNQRQAKSGAGAGEWDALRSELAALIDQVETRLLAPSGPAASGRGDAPDLPEPQSDEAFDRLDRHSRALHSVRRAVDRFSERSDAPALPVSGQGIDRARGAEIAEAIGKIRARQGARAAPQHADYVPAQVARTEAARRREGAGNRHEGGRDRAVAAHEEPAADPALLRAMLGALRDLGTRMEGFETRFSGQLADLGSNRDVADQMTQLADVVEMLAGAVGEGAPLRRMEAQIAQLAEVVAQAPATDDRAILERLEALSERLEDLSGAQVELGAGQEVAGRYADASMRFVEDSVRGIYERIDALDADRDVSRPELEKLSADLSVLARALDERDTRAQDDLAEKFASLESRIDSLGASAPDGAETLRDAVATLRGVVLDSLEPRFDALETRLDTLAIAPASGAEADPDIAAQLKRISQRIEETGVQIESLLTLARGAAEADGNQDFSLLADMVAERTRAQMPENAMGRSSLDSAAFDSLEERLSRLFAESRDSGTDAAPFEKFGETIASVDSRLAQIETLLNNQGSTAPAPLRAPAVLDERLAIAAAPAPAYARGDAMPQNPDGDAPLRQRQPAKGVRPIPDPEAVARDVRAQTAPEPFRIDPDSVARPERPVSSLSPEFEDSAQAPGVGSEPAEAAPGEGLHAAVNRANFIEAARRAARSHAETDDVEPPKSLIGRALARFHSSENANETKPGAEYANAAHQGPDADAEALSIADEQPAHAAESAARPGFLKRHRRALLLATALIVATALAANLVGQRLLSGPDAAPAEPAAESLAAPAAEPAPVEATDATPDPVAAPETDAVQLTPSPAPASSPSIDGPAPAPLPDTGNRAPAGIGADDGTAMAFAPLSGDLDTSLVDAGQNEGAIDTMTTASIGDAPTLPLVGSNALVEPEAPSMPVAEIPDGIGPEGLRLAAETGDRFAQFEIAAILTEGHVVEQDLAQAAAWYERSAAQGFAPAQYRLGNLYESGQGVEGDLEQARLWYQRAAEAGNRMSMHNLASLYAGGQLETQDFSAAAHWFEQAAARGLTDSQFNLGMLNARGLGVDQSFDQSYIWFSLAALAGDADAAQARDDVARSLDTAMIQELDAQIESWRPTELDMPANFAPIGTWDADFEVGEAITNAEVVLRVQELLGKLGYEVGTPDGVMGPMTREAIADFERATGMNATGSVNPRLLAVLGSQPV